MRFLKAVLWAAAIMVFVFLFGFVRPGLKAAANRMGATMARVEAAADAGR